MQHPFQPIVSNVYNSLKTFIFGADCNHHPG